MRLQLIAAAMLQHPGQWLCGRARHSQKRVLLRMVI